MNCTRCNQRIVPKQKYHRTKRGPHHQACSSLAPAQCYAAMSKRQKALAKKHGTPAEFARAVYETVPGFISMDEARDAINKYNREWVEAA